MCCWVFDENASGLDAGPAAWVSKKQVMVGNECCTKIFPVLDVDMGLFEHFDFSLFMNSDHYF